jgi:hypothetical protein
MRRVSPKRAVQNVQRRAFVKRLLEERWECEAQIPTRCSRLASDVHEIKTRARGGSFLDEENCLCICRPCHSWITDHTAWSLEHGFIVSSWSDHADMVAAERARFAFVNGVVQADE